MNKDNIIGQISAVEAWLAGKPLERWNKMHTIPAWLSVPNRNTAEYIRLPWELIDNDTVYRLTPIPQLVPWTYEDVPMELGWVRIKGDSAYKWAVVSTGRSGVCLGANATLRLFEALFHDYEWFNPSSKSWMPCGTSQEAR